MAELGGEGGVAGGFEVGEELLDAGAGGFGDGFVGVDKAEDEVGDDLLLWLVGGEEYPRHHADEFWRIHLIDPFMDEEGVELQRLGTVRTGGEDFGIRNSDLGVGLDRGDHIG